jgi:hypothetical protein
LSNLSKGLLFSVELLEFVRRCVTPSCRRIPFYVAVFDD